MPTIEITTRVGCSNACVYCPQGKLTAAYSKRGGDIMMSLETFKTCIDNIPSSVDIEFSGMAEPWLNPECTKMVLYANKMGHKISVYTTLVGMKESDIETMQPIPFRRFWVHLPSNNGEEKIMVDEKYLGVLRKTYDFLRPKKDSIEVSFHFRGAQVHPRVRAILGDAAIKQKKLSTRASNISVANIETPKRRKGIISCSRGLANNVLLPNGDVLLCCMDYGMQHVLGNLISDSYESIFQGKEFRKVQAGLKDESLDTLCRYCDMFAEKDSYGSKIKKALKSFYEK